MTAEPKRILLVEDDRVLRRACEASLRRKGFHVTIAVDGQAALDKLEAWTGPLPDLILLDLLMPRLTGIEVLRALRADPRTRRCPFSSCPSPRASKIRRRSINSRLPATS
jgi:CheY-like chemotaxis protein